MLILSDDFPETVTPGNGATALVMEPEETGALFAVVDPTINPDLEVVGTVAIPSYSGDVISVLMPEEIGAITEVVIGGIAYLPRELDTDPGFLFADGNLLVKLQPGHTPPEGTAIAYTALSSTYASTRPSVTLSGPHPGILYSLNVTGNLNIRLALESQPSATIEILTSKSNESYYRNVLSNGSKMILYGLGFSVERNSVTRLASQPYIRISASLTGYWAQELGEPVYPSDAVEEDSGNNGIPASDGGGSEGGPGSGISSGCKTGKATAASLGRLVNLPVKGISIEMAPVETPTTVGAVLADRAHAEGAIVDYNSSDAVYIQPWISAGRRYTISPAQIVGDISIQIGGNGQRVYGTGEATNEAEYGDEPGVLLAQEFEGNEWVPDREEEEEGNEDVEQRFISGWRNPHIPFQVTDPRDSSHAFDNGGKTKEKVVTTKFNNQTLSEEGELWGYAYAKLQLYDFTVTNIAGVRQVQAVLKPGLILTFALFWVKVREWTTVYEFDEEGYLIRVQTSGFEKVRFENDQDGSSVTLTMDYLLSDDPTEQSQLLREVALRTQFRNRQVNDYTEWTLQSMVGTFPDVTMPEEEEELATWINPRFAVTTVRTDKSQVVTPDPRSDDERRLPDLITGRDYQENQSIEIIYPLQGQVNYSPRRDYFREYNAIENQEGAGLRYGAVDKSFTENQGRPSIHTRLEKSNDRCPRKHKREDTTSDRLFLNTGLNTARRGGEEISFPGVVTPEKAVQAARTESSIENTELSETWTLTVLPTFNPSPGDWVQFDRYQFRVLEVSYPRRIIAPGKVQSPGWQIRMGRFLNPPVNLTGT